MTRLRDATDGQATRARVGVRPLSVEALRSVDAETRREEVMAALLELHGAGIHVSDQDIAIRLGWPINCVTPRRGELVTEQRIFRAGTKRSQLSRRRVAVWEPVLTGKQLEMFGGREIDFG